MNRVYLILRKGIASTWWRTVAACVCVTLAGYSTSLIAAPQLAVPPVLAPAVASSAQVPIDQQPLTLRKPIPPNIVLILDDSGSMQWNFMPDWSYLANTDNNDALIDANNNGVYYNPAITYVPPPRADGTPFTNETDMTNVPADGFGVVTAAKVNLFTYNGKYDFYETSGGSVGNGSKIDYRTSNPSGHYKYRRDYHDGHWDHDLTSWPGKNYDFKTKAGCDNWYSDFDVNRAYKPWYAYKEDYDEDKETCTIYYHTKVATYFQYSTGPADGPYVVHYVAESDCSGSPDPSRCVLASTNGAGGSGDAASIAAAQAAGAPTGVAVGQNIANWFAYYHTRILMAKSGLMRAFSSMNARYRFGFGSINNNNRDYITDNLSYTEKSGKYIADVDVFGDGSSGTQRAKFWAWVQGEKANDSTPLRAALAAVGEYYQTNQPWTTMSTDPGYGTPDQPDYLACRQSYTILTTDGFWNGGFSSGTIAGASDRTGPEFKLPNGTVVQYEAIKPFSGGGTGSSDDPSLADVATYYWENDLQPSHDDEVPTDGSVDPAFWQHMVTFTMGIGFLPTNISGTAPNGDNPPSTQDISDWAQAGGGSGSKYAISDFGWPTPAGSGGSGGSINNIADLEHAGINGHGGFFSATNPQSFIDGLKTALERVQKRTGTGASLAASSTELKTGTMIYQALYHTGAWTGDLTAYSVDPATGEISGQSWSAAAELPAAADRQIYTYAPASGGSGAYLAFKNTATATPPPLSTAELNALGSDATSQVNMVNYLRGVDSMDDSHDGPYRTRSNALGDIVDSQPVYLGAPSADSFSGETFTGSGSYATFASDNANRSAVVYVAANDGMLHEFDATTGTELYAFLPGAVITHGAGLDEDGDPVGVSELANPDYGKDTILPHQYFNDGQLTIGAAYFDSAWHTVLVGTTGRGLARTIYALDVTDPTAVKFLWERSAWDGKTNNGYIGQMVGQPIIAQVGDGQWAVLIGNGYNSTNGVAALLQFKLSDGTLSVHTTTDTTEANGLAAPAVWIGDLSNGVSTIAYAGDLHGNVWSFDLATSNSTGQKLFTAEDSGDKAQPITAAMIVRTDPDTGYRWLFFGTGRYLSSDDITDTSVQTWYGLIVDAPGHATLVGNLTNGRSALAPRSIIAQFPGDADANPPTLPTRVVTPPDDPNASMTGKSGWYLDLRAPTMDPDGTVSGYVSAGERMIVPNQFERGRLIGTTAIPKSDDLCNPSGTGWIMGVDPFTGTNPEPPFFGINGDGIVNGQDVVVVNGKSYAAAGVGYDSMLNAPITLGNKLYPGPKTGTHPPPIPIAGPGGNFTRVSWREMVNP